ncbi:MAG: hypothetical protein ACJAYK_000535, partial [Crocinitomicaceae bacterium]
RPKGLIAHLQLFNRCNDQISGLYLSFFIKSKILTVAGTASDYILLTEFSDSLVGRY